MMPKENDEPVCPFLQCTIMTKFEERIRDIESRTNTLIFNMQKFEKQIREAIKTGDTSVLPNERERIEKVVRDVIEEVIDEKKRMGEL